MTDLITAEEAEKLLDGTLLMELANEHRALLLQAIGTDDADAMVYSKDGKPTRRVSEMTSPAKQAADVISGMARTVIDLHAQLADAQAAVALMVERAATQADPWDGPVTKNKIVDAQAIAAQQIKARIRALAPADGLAAVKALRVEARENAMQALASMGQAQDAYEAQLEAEAERDRIAAELATSRARETALVEALVEQNELLRSAMQIAKREGVDGNVASTNWDAYYNRVAVSLKRHHDTVNQARATLAQTPTDPGDGWTWNERLGWIGPDGKPADPRRG